MSIRHTLKKAESGFKRLGRWLWEVIVWLGQLSIGRIAVFGPTNLFAVFSVVIALWLLVSFTKTCLEQEIRFGGLVLQIFGSFTVARKLWVVTGQFQLPSTSVWQWLKRFPTFPRHRVIAGTGAALGGAVSGSARMRLSPSPQMPLDQKVEFLTKQYAELFDEVGRLDQKVKQDARDSSAALQAESAKREKADKKYEEQLREAVVGHLDLDYAGVLYFVLGTIAGTASGDISRLLGAATCG